MKEVWVAMAGENIDDARPTEVIGVFQHRKDAERFVIKELGNQKLLEHLATPISTEWETFNEVYMVELHEVW